ncbi:penicillin-binding protein [Myxococcaceae bacterium GXIMD 01537]
MRDFKSSRGAEPNARWLALRVRLLGGLFFALLALAFGRAVFLQVFEQDKLRGLAQDQYVRQIEIPARRGDIYDRRGTPLAQSVEVDSIWVDPSMLPDVRKASRSLAKALTLDAEELQARLTRAKRFAWVKRQTKPAEVEAVKALGLPGIGFTKEPKRYYPLRELGAHVVGMVGTEGRGLEGLELAFDDELSGQNSRLSGFRDAKGRKLLVQGSLDPMERQGASVTLTIDRHLQYVAEKSLSKAVEDSRATAGMAVVLDPKTGEILALANHPRFNPNVPGAGSGGSIRNRAALDTFEPGSTMKAFVVAAALEQKAIKLDDTLFCENGAWRVGRHVIHDDVHSYGWLTPERILQVSSNIGASKVAQALGRERLVEAYHAFGFGERTGLSLPGEGRGVIPFPKAEVTLATQSFGQGMTATAVQMAAGYGALANDGLLMRPYLVQKVVDPDGVVLLENRPVEVRRPVSPQVARQVVRMLETVVVKGGTATRAAMEEYRVAGKTGTAQKVDPVARGYSDKRIASFIGMVPAENPRAVILVVMDEPKTDVYGGLVAAPAFKEIATAAMAHLAVPPSRTVAPEVAAAPPPVQAAAAVAVKPSAKPARPVVAEVVTEASEPGAIRVPDVTGQAGREAVVKLLAAALEPQLLGSGRVVSQTPAAGSLVEKGARVTLELATRQ